MSSKSFAQSDPKLDLKHENIGPIPALVAFKYQQETLFVDPDVASQRRLILKSYSAGGVMPRLA